jgi:hypothetical protein
MKTNSPSDSAFPSMLVVRLRTVIARNVCSPVQILTAGVLGGSISPGIRPAKDPQTGLTNGRQRPRLSVSSLLPLRRQARVDWGAGPALFALP